MSDESVDAGSRRPVAKFAAGGVSIAVWRHRRQADGRAWDAFSSQIQNRYLDDAGEWRDSESFSPANLADLWLVTLRALEFMRVREQEMSPTDDAPASTPF
jgi:hypothetical protein